MQKRIYDKDVKRFGNYICYTEDQLDKRFKFMCSLAKTLKGPSQQTFAKLKKMVLLWFEQMETKSKIKGEPVPDSFERTWSVEELADVNITTKEALEELANMPELYQIRLNNWVKRLRTNNCFKQHHKLFEMKNFIDSDKDQDGLLNLDEFHEYWRRECKYFINQLGQYHEKTDEQIAADFQLLCRLCHNDYGFNF